MSPFPARAFRISFGAAVLAAGTVVALSSGASPAAGAVLTVKPTGKVVVTMRGNGHGHGMSQYGAYGAAEQGLSYARILAFYYPGTTLTTLPASTIRVRLSGLPGSGLVVAAYGNLTVTGVGALPVTGVAKYRLLPNSGTGFTLQRLKSAAGSRWTTVRTGLPNRSEFWRSNGYSVRVYRTDGSSARYLGRLRAVRSGAGLYPVNRVDLDSYAAGVVPSEMPTSWSAQAVNAQAVAARTYGRYEAEHASAGSESDICDTSQCQVYDGRAQYDTSGRLLGTDYRPAARATSNRVLRYQGATVFAQFSASNGGWSSSGGQPYLTARADPYDSSQTDNPYIDYRRTITVSSLGSYFGVAKVNRIAITRRDGNGAWGGRVLAGYVSGTTSAGTAKRVTFTGDELQWALGAGTTWVTFRNA